MLPYKISSFLLFKSYRIKEVCKNWSNARAYGNCVEMQRRAEKISFFLNLEKRRGVNILSF